MQEFKSDFFCRAGAIDLELFEPLVKSIFQFWNYSNFDEELLIQPLQKPRHMIQKGQ